MYTSDSRHGAGINHANQGSAFYKPVAVNGASTAGGADMMSYDKPRNSKVSLTEILHQISIRYDESRNKNSREDSGQKLSSKYSKLAAS